MMHDYITARKPRFHNASMHTDKIGTREVIRKLMKLRGIGSERELAERASIDQSSFNRYMREDTQYMSVKSLQAVAEALLVTSSQLLEEAPLDTDAKAATVLRAMERLPEHLKDVLVATSQSLANPQK